MCDDEVVNIYIWSRRRNETDSLPSHSDRSTLAGI